MDTEEFPIRVVVSPSQSAYFAGEPFSVTITFTNTSKPDPGPSIPRSTTPRTRSHKRASHSITSAPIARPPTSPAGQKVIRTPATLVPPAPSVNANLKANEEVKARPVRRGLIGKNVEPKGAEELPDLIEQRRKKMLSLSLQTNGLFDEKKRDEDDVAMKSSLSSSTPPFRQRSLSSPSSPKIPSPLSRSETLPLAASHPHARKNSYLDGHQAIHVNEPLSSPVQNPSSSNVNPFSPLTPSSPSPLRQEITNNGVNTPSFMPFHGPPSASSSSASLASIASVDSVASYNSMNSVQSTNNINAYPIPSTPSASTFSLALDPIAETVSPLSPGSGVSPINPDASTSLNFPPSPSSVNNPHSHPSISIQAATPIKEPTGPGSHPPKTPQSPISPTRPGPRGHGRTKSYSHAAHRPLMSNGIGMGYPSEGPSSPTLASHRLHPSGTLPESDQKDGSQLILYSYAQLKGTVVLTPLPSSSSSSTSRSISSSRPPPSSSVGTPRTPYTPNPNPSSGSSTRQKYGPTPLPPPSFSQAQAQVLSEPPEPVPITPSETLLLLRSSLLKTSAGAVGGGSMDIGAMASSLSLSSSQKNQARKHSRKSSLGLSVDIRGANSGMGMNGHDGFGRAQAQSHRRTASASIGGMGMGLLNALLAPLSPSLDSEPNEGIHEGIHASRSAPNVSPGAISSNGVLTSSPHVGVGNSTLGGKERTRTLSGSVYTTGSGSDLIESGSFGSFGSLSAWLSGSNTPTSSSSFGKDVDPETPLPTFEVPPAMLAVDMMLKPGEERSYTYTIVLPSNLPPTFRGRTFCFAYELVVGVCRGSPSIPSANSKNLGLGISGVNGVSSGRAVSGSAPGGSTSKVMRVPIRVYTNVVVGRSPTPYDLLWPVFKRTQFSPGHRRGGIGRGVLSSSLSGKSRNKGGEKDVYAPKVVEIRKDGDRVVDRDSLRLGEKEREREKETLNGRKDKDKGLEELRDYAKALIESAAAAAAVRKGEDPDSLDDGDKATIVGRSISQSSTLVKDDETMGLGETGNGKVTIGCGEAVEILTRIPKKVSYDVNKDGIKVAVLTFTKAAYRLGETVQGIVELNERHSRGRVVQLSAHLETHEALPTAIASPPPPNTPPARQLKRVHAEHHSAFVLSTLRTTFSLDIPSDGSAAFQIKVGGNEEKTGSRMPSQSHSANVASPDPHSPLPPNYRVPASAPAYPSTFPSSPSPFSAAFSPLHLSSPSTFPIPPNSKPGGLEWKVRLCLLVAVASEDADPGTEDVKVKGLVRDEFDDFNDDGYGRIGRGYRGRGGDKGRGEWGSSWKAVTGVGLEKVKSKNTDKAAQASQNQNERSQNQQNQSQGMVRSWASFFASSILGSGDDAIDEDEDDSDIDGLEGPPVYDGIKPNRAGGVGVGVEYGNDSKWFGEALSPSSPNPGDDGDDGQQRRTRVRGEWRELKVETVECEVPIRVWPGNTAYKPVDVIFDV